VISAISDILSRKSYDMSMKILHIIKLDAAKICYSGAISVTVRSSGPAFGQGMAKCVWQRAVLITERFAVGDNRTSPDERVCDTAAVVGTRGEARPWPDPEQTLFSGSVLWYRNDQLLRSVVLLTPDAKGLPCRTISLRLKAVYLSSLTRKCCCHPIKENGLSFVLCLF